MHSLTVSTVLVTEVTPTDKNKVSSKTNPITKCRNEPAPKTINRWPTPALTKARWLSFGDNSSRGVMPEIRQYPPAGTALIPNSVSPRCVDQIFFPKPTKNSVTFMPNFLAVK